MRIVSLLPSATEIAYCLGLGGSVVGVTYECDHPPEARGKPVVSNTALRLEPGLPSSELDRLVHEQVDRGQSVYVLDTELIRRLEPDLILTQDLCRVCAVPSGQVEEALEHLGCTAEVVSLDPHTLDEIFENILEVGRRTGRDERAGEVVDGLRRRVAAVEEVARELPRVPVVTLEWLAPLFAGGHWVPEMVELAGGEHPLVRAGDPSRRVSWDEVARARPEVVVSMPCGYGLEATRRESAVLTEVPAVRESPAGQASRIFAVDASSYFSRSGPRIVTGLEILAWTLHPEAFPQPPDGAVARVA